MSLWDSTVMFLFLEVTDIPRARQFMEDVLGLELIENRFHPPHERHGVAKYDAGNVILALNLAVNTFAREASDGITTVFAADPQHEARIYARLYTAGLHPPRQPGAVFPDHDNHSYAVRSTPRVSAPDSEHRVSRVTELRLAVADLKKSVAFYREVLGFPQIEADREHAVLAAANLRFVLHRMKPQGPVRQDGLLIVFHTPDIDEMYDTLAQRGLDFKNLTVRYSEIGGAVRFRDPTGHTFCLYEPSEESLTWESGTKVKQLMQRLGREQTVH